MDEGLLREIASEYLVPFFSGAELEAQAEESTARDSLVAWRDPNTISFKADRSDDYRLLLKRSQSFARDSVVVPEIEVVRAFVTVISKVSEALESDLKQDILTTFQRRVVARAVGNEMTEPLLLAGIDQLTNWGARLYEGAPISASIGFRNRPQDGTSIRLGDIAENDFGAVLGNGIDTLLEFDFQGRFVSHEQLNITQHWASYCPHRQAAVAQWTATNQQQVAIILNRLSEILVLRDGQMLFARRSGKWHFLTHDPVVNQMKFPRRSRDVRVAIYETCLDASFARTGACIGVVSAAEQGSWRELVDEADQLEQRSSMKTKTISRIVAGKKFHELDRRLRQELSAIDGAMVISHLGEVLAVGAILKISGGSTGGGRFAAAKALSKKGLGIKISQDGGIIGLQAGRNTPAFRVM